MPWPTDDLSTDNVDSGTDNPSRSDFLNCFQIVKELIAGRGSVNGVASLGSDSKLVSAQRADPAAVSTYVSARDVYFRTTGNTILFRVDTELSISVTESIGPTGSGAANIWTALDEIPADAKAIYIMISNFCTNADGAGLPARSNFYVAQNGNGINGFINELISHNYFDGDTSDDNTEVTLAWVPLDGSRRFQARWDQSNTSFRNITILLRGFAV